MKLTCNNIQRFISDYIDGALSSRDAANVEKHLRFCSVCRREVVAFKKTRDLVVDFYVEPEASENYFHQFEVELHRCIDNKGPIHLDQRIRTTAAQFIWMFATQIRQSFSEYSLLRKNALPLCALILLIVTGFVVPHLLNQPPSSPPIVFLDDIDSGKLDTNSELGQGSYSERRADRKSPSAVSSPTAVNVENVDYWKLSEPVTSDTEAYIIVMHVSKDDAVPGDAVDSDLAVSTQPDILGSQPLLQDDDYATLPLDLHDAPIYEKYQLKYRKLSGFVGHLMHVPSELLTIPEPYDISKL